MSSAFLTAGHTKKHIMYQLGSNCRPHTVHVLNSNIGPSPCGQVQPSSWSRLSLADAGVQSRQDMSVMRLEGVSAITKLTEIDF